MPASPALPAAAIVAISDTRRTTCIAPDVTLMHEYALPEHADITIPRLLGEATALHRAGFEPVAAWLLDPTTNRLVGFAIGARRRTPAAAAEPVGFEAVERFREAGGADLAHAQCEWEAC